MAFAHLLGHNHTSQLLSTPVTCREHGREPSGCSSSTSPPPSPSSWQTSARAGPSHNPQASEAHQIMARIESEESLPLLAAEAADAARLTEAGGQPSPPSSPIVSPSRDSFAAVGANGNSNGLQAPSECSIDEQLAAAEEAARKAWRMQMLGLALYALSTVCGTGMSLCAKLAGRGGVGVFEVVLFRSLTLLAFTIPELLWRRLNPFEDPRRRWAYILRGALGFLSTSSLYLAVNLLRMADAAVLAFLSPVWVALLSPIVLKETPSRAVFLAIPCCMVGVIFTSRPSFIFGGASGMPLIGIIVGIMQAFFNAAARMSVRAIHSLGGKEYMASIIFSMGLVSATLAAIPMAILPEINVYMPRDVTTWLAVAGNGLLGYGNQVTLTAALQRATAAPAVAMGYLSVVWGLIADVLIFHDYPTILSLVGALIVCASSFFVAWGEKRKRDKEKVALRLSASQARLSRLNSCADLLSSQANLLALARTAPSPEQPSSPHRSYSPLRRPGGGSGTAAPLLTGGRAASP